MTGTSSSMEHLSVVMTTETVADVTQTTAANVTITPPSRGIAFYFQCAVVVIGVVGMAANALILYALFASEQRKKLVLIFHQNVLDFVSSFFLVITYSLKLCDIYLFGLGGYWLCMLILSENLIWCAIHASKTNLMVLTIERYLKVVYPVWSKKCVGRNVLYSAMAFVWISAIVHLFVLTFSTSVVVDGVCYGYVVWKSREYKTAYGIWAFISFYAIVLMVFIFCYWRILVAIRRQARVMASHGSTSGQAQSHQTQTNVIKTMILVSALFAITHLPMEVYSQLFSIHPSFTILEGGYYAVMFVSFLYICANPFIYATKFDPVKRVLLGLNPCKKASVLQPVEWVEMNVAGTAPPHRTGQARK